MTSRVETIVAGAGAVLAVVAAVWEPGIQPRATATLDWRAPADCPTSGEVRTQLAHQLDEAVTRVEARATVLPVVGGYVLTLDVVADAHAQPTRTVQASSCETLGEAAALLVAVAAEQRHVAGPPTTVPVAPALPTERRPPAPAVAASLARTPESKAAPAAPAPVVAEPPRASSRRLSGLVRAEAIGQAARLLPSPVAIGVGLAAGLRSTKWRAEVRGTYFVPQRVRYQDRAGAGDIDLWTVGAVGCYEPRAGRWSLPLCGGANAGAMRGRGRGVQVPDAARYPFAEVVGEVGATWAVRPRWALLLAAQGAASLTRPRFHIDGAPTLFTSAGGAFRLHAGLEVRLP